MNLADAIRTIPDYPKPGIMFRDITTLLGDAAAFREAVDQLVAPYRDAGLDKVAGIEARGFILGGAVAYQLGLGFIPLRKRGKLPHKVIAMEYDLEYGTDVIEMHHDACRDQALAPSRRRRRRRRLRDRPARPRRRQPFGSPGRAGHCAAGVRRALKAASIGQLCAARDLVSPSR
jgi:hypothetical protein